MEMPKRICTPNFFRNYKDGEMSLEDAAYLTMQAFVQQLCEDEFETIKDKENTRGELIK